MSLAFPQSIDVSGGINENDIAAAKSFVEQYNAETEADPPLATSPAAALKTSYEVAIEYFVQAQHDGRAKAVKDSNRFRPEVKQAALSVDDATWAQVEALLGL